jgi:hypothetical protein
VPVETGTSRAPTTPPTSAAVTAPSDFCSAVDAIRNAGVIDGHVKPEGLPYLEQMRDVAPPDLQAPIVTMIEWIQNGSPTPVPAEVSAAELQSTRDWISRCQSNGQTTIAPPQILQVLNASGVAGSATAHTNQIRSRSGWLSVTAGNAPVNRTGSAVQCRSSGPDGDVLVALLQQLLRSFGVSAAAEPVPNPLPTQYDSSVTCYVILGR